MPYLKNPELDKALALVALFLRTIPADAISEGLEKARRAEAFGPILNPGPWLGPETFERHGSAIEVLEAALELRRALERQDRICHGVTNLIAENPGLLARLAAIAYSFDPSPIHVAASRHDEAG
jgi:hypothetical protein